jgi:alanine transaminase
MSIVFTPILSEYFRGQESIYSVCRTLSTYNNFGDDDIEDPKLGTQNLIASSLEQRDKIAVSPNRIIICNDILGGISKILDLSINEGECVMLPRPYMLNWNNLVQYKNGIPLFYDLNADDDWQIDEAHLEEQFAKQTQNGKTVRAILISHPSDITGSILSLESIRRILGFAYRRNLLVMVEESNGHVFTDSEEYFSFKKALQTLPDEIKSNLQLVIFDSKKFLFTFDSGFKSGYLELVNFDEETTSIISNYIALDPPGLVDSLLLACHYLTSSDSFSSTVSDEFNQVVEMSKSQQLIENKLKLCFLTKMVSQIQTIKNPPFKAGIHYLPKFVFPKKFISEAKEQGKEPDFLFCEMLFANEKIIAWPGSYFGCRTSDYIRLCRLNSNDILYADVYHRFKMFYLRLIEDFN